MFGRFRCEIELVVWQVRVFAENELGRSKEGRVLQVFFTSNNLALTLHLIRTVKSTFHFSQFGTDGERPEGTAR